LSHHRPSHPQVSLSPVTPSTRTTPHHSPHTSHLTLHTSPQSLISLTSPHPPHLNIWVCIGGYQPIETNTTYPPRRFRLREDRPPRACACLTELIPGLLTSMKGTQQQAFSFQFSRHRNTSSSIRLVFSPPALPPARMDEIAV
jgi:hypothetical protein